MYNTICVFVPLKHMLYYTLPLTVSVPIKLILLYMTAQFLGSPKTHTIIHDHSLSFVF
jgi:hypothetical protein